MKHLKMITTQWREAVEQAMKMGEEKQRLISLSYPDDTDQSFSD